MKNSESQLNQALKENTVLIGARRPIKFTNETIPKTFSRNSKNILGGYFFV